MDDLATQCRHLKDTCSAIGPQKALTVSLIPSLLPDRIRVEHMHTCTHAPSRNSKASVKIGSGPRLVTLCLVVPAQVTLQVVVDPSMPPLNQGFLWT